MGKLLSFASKTTRFGIDWGHYSVKLVGLQKRGNKPQLTHCALFPIPAGAGKSSVQEKISHKIESWNEKDAPASFGMEGKDVNVRYMKLPEMSKREFQKAAIWEIRDQMYFKAEDAYFRLSYLGVLPDGSVKKSHGVVYAIRKSAIHEKIEHFQKIPVKPRAIFLASHADCVSSIYGKMEKENVLLLNIGYAYSRITIINAGKVFFFRDINLGGKQITEEISANLSLSSGEAESLKRKMVLEPGGLKIPGSNYSAEDLPFLFQFIEFVLDPLVEEIQLSHQFFAGQIHESVSKIILSGGGALLTGIDAYLSEKIGIAVEKSNPFESVYMDGDAFDTEELTQVAPIFSTAIGLAKSQLTPRKECFNILEILKEEQEKQRKQGSVFRLASLSSLLFVLAFTFLFIYKTANIRKEKIVFDSKYENVQHRLTFLKKLEKKTGLLSTRFETLLDIKNREPRWSILLKAIGKHIPEGTWITDFNSTSLQGSNTPDWDTESGEEETRPSGWRLVLKGKSYSGSDVRLFYNQLQKMPYFKRVNLVRIALSGGNSEKNLLDFRFSCDLPKDFGQTVYPAEAENGK
ncbi:competence protein A [bacterium BMS3Abin05]|nr:competence protein A [bacterium BMS3Abin05]HDZ12589.1 type IV pilus assembly protein PilM [Bacteroidota bacterium]